MLSIDEIKKILIESDVKKTIVFPEGDSSIIQEVANILADSLIAKPILLFDKNESIPKKLNSKVKYLVIDKERVDQFANKFVEIRNGKATKEEAINLICKTNYYAAMMVNDGDADCMLCGLTFTTADTIRPALQIIKTNKNTSVAASVFIMKKGSRSIFFSDCALNIKPDSSQLQQIAIMTAEFAKTFGIQNPEVALLSYSTNGSGYGEDVVRVKEAITELKKTKHDDIVFEGELQFDAAWNKNIRDKKYPSNLLKKEIPDVFIFPDINAGNIGYKIAQQMGDYEAIGPFVLGLNKPVNDLSRGATLQDVLNTAIVTIFQSKENK